MNTADRTITLIDSALRRRFHFYPFFVDQPPIKGLLRRWLKANKSEMLWVADVVDAANQKLEADLSTRHSAIGPSHFMRSDLDNDWVELVWRYSVIPYIEEQFFAEEERVAAYSLDRLKSGDRPEPASEVEPEGENSD